MLKTNRDKLVVQSVQGKIHHPVAITPYRISVDGEARILPATGGITYNVQVGSAALGWAGDHVEPGVTIRNENKQENMALNLFACIGNEAKVLTGEAKGAKGYVTGTHGGVEHVLVYFFPEDLDKMAVDDQILIKACGQGLELLDYPEVKVMNIDPRLFTELDIQEVDGQLEVAVAAVVPAHLMGSGIGSATAASGDYDITTADWQELAAHGLDKLRLGDLVFLQDYDTSYGRGYRKGAASIGVVIHADSIKAGHGPGVTTFMTSSKGALKPKLDAEANIVKYLRIG